MLRNEIPFYRHILHVHIEEKSDALLQQRKQNNWNWGICSKIKSPHLVGHVLGLRL